MEIERVQTDASIISGPATRTILTDRQRRGLRQEANQTPATNLLKTILIQDTRNIRSHLHKFVPRIL